MYVLETSSSGKLNRLFKIIKFTSNQENTVLISTSLNMRSPQVLSPRQLETSKGHQLRSTSNTTCRAATLALDLRVLGQFTIKKPKSLKADWTFHHRIDGELKQAHLLFGYIEN